MKLSRDTIEVLKNFSQINPNLVVREGHQLKSVAISECLMATADVEESFPAFAIYDLPEFLGVLSLFKDPDLTFSDNAVCIKEGSNVVEYVFGDEKTFKVRPPEKDYPFPDVDISIQLTETMLKDLMRAASILKLEDIAVASDGNEVCVQVVDAKNPSSNNFKAVLDVESTGTYNMVMKVENLRIMPGDYKVEISRKKVAKFTNMSKPITYFIALHASSTFES